MYIKIRLKHSYFFHFPLSNFYSLEKYLLWGIKYKKKIYIKNWDLTKNCKKKRWKITERKKEKIKKEKMKRWTQNASKRRRQTINLIIQMYKKKKKEKKKL